MGVMEVQFKQVLQVDKIGPHKQKCGNALLSQQLARKPMNTQINCLQDLSRLYGRQMALHVAKLRSTPHVSMVSQLLGFMDPIPVLRFLYTFKAACDNKRVHKEAQFFASISMVK